LKDYYQEDKPYYVISRQIIREILQEESQLQEFVQLVGKDSLSEEQKTILEFAKIIKEDFLQQNAYTPYDYFCPMSKTIGMMKIIAEAYSGIKMLLQHSANTENSLTWNEISMYMKTELIKVSRMKELEPRLTDPEINQFFEDLSKQIKNKINEIEEKL